MTVICAVYSRSSKDRANLSCTAQVEAARTFILSKGWREGQVYIDSGVSGSEVLRPGLDQLFRDAQKRVFNRVVILDSSRLSRSVATFAIFKSRLEAVGVRLHFLNEPSPEDQATANLFSSIITGINQFTSETASAKSRKSQSLLIKQKYRAGGVAPRGYRVEHEMTGVVKAGNEVRRGRWVLSDEWDSVRDFLTLRSQGVPRTEALRRLKLEWDAPTACSMERRALLGIYCGDAVHGRREKVKPSVDNPQRVVRLRPEDEWTVVPDAHPPIISREVMDRLRHVLAASPRFGRPKSLPGSKGRIDSLLGGVAYDAVGTLLQVDSSNGRKYYRAPRGLRVRADRVDNEVLWMISEEAKRGDVVTRLMAKAQAAAENVSVEVDRLHRERAELEKKIARAVDALVEGNSTALRGRLVSLEAELASVSNRLDNLASEREVARLARTKRIVWDAYFDFARAPIPDAPVDLTDLRSKVHGILDRVNVTPEGEVSAYYRFPDEGSRLALPEGFEPSYQP